jgi:hypothetical protein
MTIMMYFIQLFYICQDKIKKDAYKETRVRIDAIRQPAGGIDENAGNVHGAEVGCCPTLPTIIMVPLLEMSLIVTNNRAGSGWRRSGLRRT